MVDPRKVALVGFMGSGKTTVGRELALRLGWRFLDLDTAIELRERRSVREIFANHGESTFRALEEAALAEAIASPEPLVVATGGGVVGRAECRVLLRAPGVQTLWLDPPLGEMLRRLAQAREERPLAQGRGWRARLGSLYTLRAPLYEEVASARLSGASPAQAVAEQAVQILALREGSFPGVEPGGECRVELGARSYPIVIGAQSGGLAGALHEVGASRRLALITDNWLRSRHAASLAQELSGAGFEPEIHALPVGEAAKSIDSLQSLWGWLISKRFDRGHSVLAVGGGAVGDAAGFAAATYHRGIPLVQVPTTLLAQVDSAIGGKTAINHPAAKNAVGAFHQPRLVYSDVRYLATLSRRDLHSGLAEAAKTALLSGPSLTRRMLELWPYLASACLVSLSQVVVACAEHKAWVVAVDEREGGELRHSLNFGHTLGHALESLTGFQAFRHGEAVAWGMRAALWLSGEQGAAPSELAEAMSLVNLIETPDIPSHVTPTALARATLTDKKAVGGQPRFVVLNRLGAPALVSLPARNIVRAARWLCAQKVVSR